MTRPELRLAAEHRTWPTWVDTGGGGVDNPDPHDLGLPDELADALCAWSDEYDALWLDDDPAAGPQFADRAAEVETLGRLRTLAARVAAATGDRWSVRVRDADGRWERLS